jgi:hypothetical protein
VSAVKLQGSDITPLLTSGWITPAKVKPAAQLYTWKKFKNCRVMCQLFLLFNFDLELTTIFW